MPSKEYMKKMKGWRAKCLLRDEQIERLNQRILLLEERLRKQSGNKKT
jgi:hypothetical protein